MLKTMVVNLLNKFRMICLNKNSNTNQLVATPERIKLLIQELTKQRDSLKDQERENDTAVNTDYF